ncbi:HAD-like domain-containing protein [Pelagophyceae sp. CCMP2097]|nr:HAD-like domain-containing protein [Pelagophyceae sp. CCMP2097]
MPAARDERSAVRLRDGADWWLKALKAQDVPCAVVSRLPRRLVQACLDKLNVAQFFGDRVVSAECDRVDADQAFLHAALALERQPQRCAVFSDAVSDCVQAREAGMRSVGVMGRHSRGDLHVADLAIARLDELRLSNIRSLFADIEYEPTPDLEAEAQRKVVKSRWDDESGAAGSKNRWSELNPRWKQQEEDDVDGPDTETGGPGGGGKGGNYRDSYSSRKRRP